MSKGKKQKLNDARKEVMNSILTNLDNDKDTVDDLSDEMENNFKNEMIFFKTGEMLKKVQENLFKYVEENHLPIGEFLSVDDIEEFINLMH